jgi:hypothetical protein
MSACVTGAHFPTDRMMAVERSSERRRCAATATMRASLALLIIKSFSELRSSQEHDAFVAASEKTI